MDKIYKNILIANKELREINKMIHGYNQFLEKINHLSNDKNRVAVKKNGRTYLLKDAFQNKLESKKKAAKIWRGEDVDEVGVLNGDRTGIKWIYN